VKRYYKLRGGGKKEKNRFCAQFSLLSLSVCEREERGREGERSKKVNESIWFCGSRERGRWSNKFYVRVLMDCVRSHLKGKF
jgi:hypothetical protein